MSSTCFEPEGSSSGRLLYMQVRYSVSLHAEITIKGFYKISKYKVFEFFKCTDMNIKHSG